MHVRAASSSVSFSAPKPVRVWALAPSVVRVNSLYTAKPSSVNSDSNSMAAAVPKWAQKTITLPPQRRGCHLITPKVTVFCFIDLILFPIRSSLILISEFRFLIQLHQFLTKYLVLIDALNPDFE